MREDLDLYNIGHGAFWETSFRSGLLSIGLYTLRSTELCFERNNRYTTCFSFSLLLRT